MADLPEGGSLPDEYVAPQPSDKPEPGSPEALDKTSAVGPGGRAGAPALSNPRTVKKKRTRKEKNASKMMANIDDALDPTLIPKIETDGGSEKVGAHNAAVALLAEVRAAQQDKGFGKPKEGEWVWWMRCENCNGPGIWLFTRSGIWLEPNDWCSSYKQRGQLWPSKDIPCQICLAAGTTIMLRTLHNKGTKCRPVSRFARNRITMQRFLELTGQEVPEQEPVTA
jgi:hypothetical protein